MVSFAHFRLSCLPSSSCVLSDLHITWLLVRLVICIKASLFIWSSVGLDSLLELCFEVSSVLLHLDDVSDLSRHVHAHAYM